MIFLPPLVMVTYPKRHTQKSGDDLKLNTLGTRLRMLLLEIVLPIPTAIVCQLLR
jgi:hypothetical protein